MDVLQHEKACLHLNIHSHLSCRSASNHLGLILCQSRLENVCIEIRCENAEVALTSSFVLHYFKKKSTHSSPTVRPWVDSFQNLKCKVLWEAEDKEQASCTCINCSSGQETMLTECTNSRKVLFCSADKTCDLTKETGQTIYWMWVMGSCFFDVCEPQVPYECLEFPSPSLFPSVDLQALTLSYFKFPVHRKQPALIS